MNRAGREVREMSKEAFQTCHRHRASGTLFRSSSTTDRACEATKQSNRTHCMFQKKLRSMCRRPIDAKSSISNKIRWLLLLSPIPFVCFWWFCSHCSRLRTYGQVVVVVVLIMFMYFQFLFIVATMQFASAEDVVGSVLFVSDSCVGTRLMAEGAELIDEPRCSERCLSSLKSNRCKVLQWRISYMSSYLIDDNGAASNSHQRQYTELTDHEKDQHFQCLWDELTRLGAQNLTKIEGYFNIDDITCEATYNQIKSILLTSAISGFEMTCVPSDCEKCNVNYNDKEEACQSQIGCSGIYGDRYNTHDECVERNVYVGCDKSHRACDTAIYYTIGPDGACYEFNSGCYPSETYVDVNTVSYINEVVIKNNNNTYPIQCESSMFSWTFDENTNDFVDEKACSNVSSVSEEEDDQGGGDSAAVDQVFEEDQACDTLDDSEKSGPPITSGASPTTVESSNTSIIVMVRMVIISTYVFAVLL